MLEFPYILLVVCPLVFLGGLIDAVACLLELGLIDESGYMENDRVEIAENIFLTQGDVRAV